MWYTVGLGTCKEADAHAVCAGFGCISKEQRERLRLTAVNLKMYADCRNMPEKKEKKRSSFTSFKNEESQESQ